MRSFFRRRSGFTLTELTVTAAILAILAGAALPLAKISVKREKEIELRRDLRLMREAIDAYKKLADEKKIEVEDGTDGYPPDLDVLVKGVKVKGASEGGKKDGERIVKFLRRIPRDPLTGTSDWGFLSTQDPPDASAWGEENVFDVYSRSRGTAIDGTKYRDW
jgi:general secretion pathway protein G